MAELLAFMIIIVFLVVTIVVCWGLRTISTPEHFTSQTENGKYTPSKFYTTSPNKFEKANSLYSPIITRPRDIYAHRYGDRCTNQLYPKAASKYGKGEIAGPCCPDVGGRYYGMRPILTPEALQKMVKTLFEHVTQKVPSQVDQNRLKYQNQFCDSDSYSEVMKYVIRRLNQGQANLPIFKNYAKADTWGGDTFAYLNEEIFMFTEQNPAKFSDQEQAKRARKKNGQDTKYVLTFTLYMPLRSLSLDTTAILFRHKGKYYLNYIDFTTKSESRDGPMGVNVESFKTGEILQPDMGGLPPGQSTPNWIYGNALENKTFNLKGFHDPEESKNILIPGGVPEEYKSVLEKCDQGYLMDPAGSEGPRMKGGYQDNSNKLTAPVYPNFPNKNEVWNVRV